MFVNNYQQVEAEVHYRVSQLQNEMFTIRRAQSVQKATVQVSAQREQFLREILTRVNYGEISVEEGLKYLRQV